MFQAMDSVLLAGQMKLARFFDRLWKEEEGASDMVAIMVLVVVIIGVAVAFNEGLTAATTSVFDRLTTFITSE